MTTPFLPRRRASSAPLARTLPAQTLSARTLLALSLCAGLAPLAGCTRPAPAEPVAPTPAADGSIGLTPQQLDRLGVRLARVEAAPMVPLATVPGVVSLPPEARVAVTSPYSGVALRVLVIPGQAVRQGDVLGVVRAADTVQYSASLARSQAELPVVAANAARLDQLAREGIIASARADEARAALAATRATIAENRRLLSLGGASRDGTITLRAPIAGRVATVAIDVGGAVGSGAAPFVIENAAALRLDLQLPERLAGQVRPGLKLTVAQDGRSTEGEVLSIAPSLDPLTRSLAAKGTLPAGSSMVPGKGVMVTITGPRPAGAVAVPATAVTRIGDHDVVFVRTPTGLRATPVRAAGQIGDVAYLSSGVAAGSRVAISAIAELKTLSGGQ